MDAWVVVAVALGVALLLVGRVAVRRGAALARVRDALGSSTSPSGGEVEPALLVGRLRAASARAAAELGEVRRDRAELIEALESGVLVVDAGLLVREANGPAHALLSRPPGSLVGRSLIETFLDPEVEQVVRTALDVGSGRIESRPAGPDGPVIVARARRSTDGRCWLVLDDVSELRRLQRIRTEFLDNLSHELRTPLTTVSLLAETLSREARAEGDVVPQRMRDRIDKIEVETGHLVQMVSELMDLSRIESGGTLELVDGVDLGRLVVDSAERLRLFAERQGVRLRTDAGDGLPTVHGDAVRLGQVVVNLVHNAVKFSPEGGEVAVSSSLDGGSVVVTVEDHGVGIPRSAQDRVFERFYKVDRARLRAEAGGGTGLGLAIARHVVEQHGGRIRVESTEGLGSTFSFSIPVASD